jgi:hypothetical protein
MSPIKKTVVILLAILVSNSFSVLDSQAFFTCQKQQCRKKTNSFSETSFVSSESSTGRNYSFLLSGGGNNENSNNSGGITPPANGNNSQLCATNIQAISNRVSYLGCQIDTANKKAGEIITLVNKLFRLIENLLNVMQGARVCTNRGYTLPEYNANHNFSTNLTNLILIQKELNKLKVALEKISITCQNCQDQNAVNEANRQLDLIQESLNRLKSEFSSELNLIFGKINSFVNRVNQVIRSHNTDIRGIMNECGVSRRVASIMRSARLLAIRAFRNFENLARTHIRAINDIKFSEHDCSLLAIKDDLVADCANVI